MVASGGGGGGGGGHVPLLPPLGSGTDLGGGYVGPPLKSLGPLFLRL